MTDLEKFELVNKCDSSKELSEAILSIADPKTGLIKGRTRAFDATRMANFVEGVVRRQTEANVLTREFGIRQQALYLAYYEKV
ncbi:MAG: hypothetical protein ACOH2V_00630 [Candidatus Saccharimonadaceae bacterium]